MTSYTCVTSAYREAGGTIHYARMKDSEKLGSQSFTTYQMKDLAENQPWRLCDAVHDDLIYKIEHVGTPLGTWKIRNGLATLKNDLYFFVPDREDDAYYYRMKDGKEFPIEKSACIDIVKPNTIKTEKELADNRESNFSLCQKSK